MLAIDLVKIVALHQGNIAATGGTAIFIEKPKTACHDLK
jgi:hypothetical protein